MLWVHGCAGAAFIALWIAAALTGWVKSPTFISHVSMIALVYAAFTGWQGAQAADEAHDEG
jgi:hypothetical protein